MRILTSALDLQAQHQFARARHEEVRERITPLPRPAAVATPANLPAPPSAPVQQTSPAPTPAAEPTRLEPDDPLAHVEGRLRVLAALIERITGQALRLVDASLEPQAKAPSLPPSATPAAPGAAPRAAEDGPVRIDRSALRMRMEYEAISFQAQGLVQTADGRTIRFELGFQLERSFFELTMQTISEVRERLKDPLVISLHGPAAFGEGRFAFDLDADGQLDQLPRLAAGQGFLALDRNGNGRIDHGRELFGAQSGHGFAELAALDGDGNGWLDEADPLFARLKVWLDAGEGGRLLSLNELGIGAIALRAMETPFEHRTLDQSLQAKLRQSGVWLGEDGRAGLIQQLDLAV